MDNLRAINVSKCQEICCEFRDFYCMSKVIDSRNVAYEIFRLRRGKWIPTGFYRDPIPLPEEVSRRLAEGRPGKLEVNGVLYWIRLVERSKN
jgi:hypothetical protein